MPIKPCLQHCVSTALLLMLAATATQAEPATEKASPYRLNIQPAKMPQLLAPQSSDPQTVYPQAYQLEYKYRAPSNPAKSIKAELPAIPPADNLPADKIAVAKFPASNSIKEKLASQPFASEIALAADAASLDPALVHAVIYVESRYHHKAISLKGAIGLMQVLPDTAARYGISDAGNSPKANLKAGTLYLRDLMLMFDNRLDLVLAAYNAGEGAVVKYSGKIPPYRETRQYVLAVMAKYNEWRNLDAGAEIVGDDNVVDTGIAQPIKPVKPVEAQYLMGTRLAVPEDLFSPNY